MTGVAAALPAVALALLASLLAGRLAARVGVPRVTAFLLVGIALGPHGLPHLTGWADSPLALGPGSDAALGAVEALAIGFILFGVGGAFSFEALRRVGARIHAIAGAQVGATALLVSAAVFAATGSGALALIAPALAIATAPSATLVTLHEVEAEGPASRALVLCVGFDNLAALLAFPVLLSLAFGTGSPLPELGRAGLALAGGAAIGVVCAFTLEIVSGAREQSLLGLLAIVAALALASGLGAGSTGLGMLCCFGAGMALANASPHAGDLLRRVDALGYPLYVLFFVASGRDLHFESLAALGGLGAMFVAARALGKLGGTALGLRLAGVHDELPRTLGAGLLCQAGVALGLVAALEAAAPEATRGLRDVVLASVVCFELAGPWLLRRTAIRAGEVPLANLLPRPGASSGAALRWVGIELRRNLGLVGSDPTGRELSVRHAMRRRPTTVPEALPFQAVLRALGEAGADLLPVLDREGRLVGTISYDEVKNALYDPVLRDLVIARDLAEEAPDPLEGDDTLAEALERMDRHQVHAWPVVEQERLLGLVRRQDVYALLRRGLGGAASGGGSSRRSAQRAEGERSP
ncbi:MAG: cation:proton antiporter [Myxococcota bacterium]|nr:cation:proton antiporter [Myxococcota bacterium]